MCKVYNLASVPLQSLEVAASVLAAYKQALEFGHDMQVCKHNGTMIAAQCKHCKVWLFGMIGSKVIHAVAFPCTAQVASSKLRLAAYNALHGMPVASDDQAQAKQGNAVPMHKIKQRQAYAHSMRLLDSHNHGSTWYELSRVYKHKQGVKAPCGMLVYLTARYIYKELPTVPTNRIVALTVYDCTCLDRCITCHHVTS